MQYMDFEWSIFSEDYYNNGGQKILLRRGKEGNKHVRAQNYGQF